MKLPDKHIGNWAQELADECMVSQKQRRDHYSRMRDYYLNGSADGNIAKYNRCYSHIDRLASYLYSPSDVRFLIEYDMSEGAEWMAMAERGGTYLNREFHRCDVDMKFGHALDWALVKGSTFLKAQWGSDGLDPWIIQPEFMGVFREDIQDLDRQEAIVQVSYLTPGQFRRLVSGKHNGAELIAKIEAQGGGMNKASEEIDEAYLHQIVFGALHPVSVPGGSTGTNSGMVSVPSAAIPVLSPQIMSSLIKFHEMYVLDDDRDDYTTLRWVSPDIVVDGQHVHENLFLREEQPFSQICANKVAGYFWGMSELTEILPLQDMLNNRIDNLDRLFKLRAKPPTSFTGFSGITEQKYQELMSPGGWIQEQNPNAKAQAMAPDIPPELMQTVHEVIGYMDDVGGFPSILKGEGEAGTRSGAHAETLVATGSPRLKDRALMVERQLGNVGDKCFKLLLAKVPTLFTSKLGKSTMDFLLADLPDDYRVNVDSHSGSPAFQQEHRSLVQFMLKAGAIGPEEALILLNPPHLDMLLARVRSKQEAQAKLVQEHPELAFPKGKKK